MRIYQIRTLERVGHLASDYACSPSITGDRLPSGGRWTFGYCALNSLASVLSSPGFLRPRFYLLEEATCFPSYPTFASAFVQSFSSDTWPAVRMMSLQGHRDPRNWQLGLSLLQDPGEKLDPIDPRCCHQHPSCIPQSLEPQHLLHQSINYSLQDSHCIRFDFRTLCKE